MRKVVLTMIEEHKYNIIKKLVDNDDNKHRAASKLKCSLRHINRLIIFYKTKGKDGFVHGNRNRKPISSFSCDTKNKVVNLFNDSFSNCNITHFSEILIEDYNISVSDSTIHKCLKEEMLVSCKARKSTRRKIKKKLHTELDISSTKTEKNNIVQHIETLDDNEAYPRRPRSKYKGEMIQMDATSFEFVQRNIWHLHLAVDDASGEVVGAYLDNQETLNGYYHVFSQILTDYGIPAMFYTDRRNVFEYKKKNTLLDKDDTFTQF